MACVTALNDDIANVSPDMIFDEYLEMIDKYKEFVKQGYKMRYRPSKEEAFPDQERSVYGKNIVNANVSTVASDDNEVVKKKLIFQDVITNGKPTLFVGSPMSASTSVQLQDRLKAVIDSAAAMADIESVSSPATQSTASTLMPPPTAVETPRTRGKGRATGKDSKVLIASNFKHFITYYNSSLTLLQKTSDEPATAAKRKRSSPVAEANKKKKEEEAKRKADEKAQEKERKDAEKKKKAEEVARAKAEKEREKIQAKLKRLQERARKAKDSKLRQKVREEAKEILKNMTSEETEKLKEQFSILVDPVADAETSSHGLSDEDIFSDDTIIGSARGTLTNPIPGTSGTQQQRARSKGSGTSSESAGRKQPREQADRDSLGRERSPPGKPAQEKAPATKSTKATAATKDLMAKINAAILAQEGEEEVKC